MKLTKNQALALIELNRGNTVIIGRTQTGRRFARWKNWRGKTRAGKFRVATARSFKKRDYIEPMDVGVNEWCISEHGMGAADFAQERIDNGHYDKERKVKVTADDIVKALEAYYSATGFIVVPEVSIAWGGERRADALVVGNSNETAIAIEIKISPQDYQHELENEEKRQLALELSSQYYFACPAGLVSEGEIPEECGLLELGVDGKISPTVEAPYRRPDMPSWRLVGAVARALKR